MKIKLFGIIWDFRPIIGAIWAFVGCLCIGYTFMLDTSPWWINLIWGFTLVTFISTAESFSKWLTGE